MARFKCSLNPEKSYIRTGGYVTKEEIFALWEMDDFWAGITPYEMTFLCRLLSQI